MKLHPALFLFAYALSGLTLKTADVLGERGKILPSFLSATISAFLFGVLTSESVFSASLILGMIIGVTVSKKVDRPNMVFGLILTLLFAVYLGVQTPTLWLLTGVAFFTFIDEVGHEKHRQKKGFPAFFFRYRLSLKLALIVLTLGAQIQALQLMGFLCFDLGYDVTSHLINKAWAPLPATNEK